MRTQVTIIYKFHELSETAQERAVAELRDLNVDHKWWESVYEDANNIGLKITSFELYRNRHAEGDFSKDALVVAYNILREHGDRCDTHQTAKDYFFKHKRLVAEQCQEDADCLCVPLRDEIDLETIKYNQEELDTDDIDQTFLQSLLGDYATMIQKEYEYLTSDEAITKTIKINEYEFTEEGDLV